MQRVELIEPFSRLLNTKDYPKICDANHCHEKPAPGSLLCERHIDAALNFFADQLALTPADHMKRDITLQYGQAWTYLVGSRQHRIVKIGVTTRLKQRMSSLRNSSPAPIKLFAVVFGSPKIETALHEKFAKDRQHGEWFTLTDEISEFIEDVKTGEIGKHVDASLFPETIEQRIKDLVHGIKCREDKPWSMGVSTAIDFLA